MSATLETSTELPHPPRHHISNILMQIIVVHNFSVLFSIVFLYLLEQNSRDEIVEINTPYPTVSNLLLRQPPSIIVSILPYS